MTQSITNSTPDASVTATVATPPNELKTAGALLKALQRHDATAQRRILTFVLPQVGLVLGRADST